MFIVEGLNLKGSYLSWNHTVKSLNQVSQICKNDPNILDSAQKNPTQVVFENLYLPIALRKGVRSCTMHPISHFVSYKGLSSPFRAFTTNISYVEILRFI